MEKILFITDAIKFHTSSVDFAAFLCNLTHSKLTGLFLENLEKEERSAETIKEAAAMSGVSNQQASVPELKEHCCSDNIQRFMKACEAREINCTVHRGRGIPLDDVIAESRYADLLLIDAETSFSARREGLPSDFVKSVLADTECPVVVLPGSFYGIEQLVFTYDGRPSSVFAIKQFTYLFPELREQRVLVISVSDEKGGPDPEERYRLREWLHMHYKEVDFDTTEGNVKAELLERLLRRTKAFIVMGAYGRSALSTLFTPSHATPVLEMVNQPIFIAHR